MDFLHEKLNVAAAPPGHSNSFLANLLEPRPDFDTIAAYADWGTKVQQEMLASKARKTCPVAWVGLFVDQEGLLIVFHFARKLKLGDAKTAARTMTSFLVEELQEALYANLHPFDELDRRRLDGWVTPISLRPEGLGKKRAREEEGGECQTLAKRPKTMAQFLAQWEEDDAEVDCPPAPTVQSIQIARRDPDARCELTTLEQLNDPLKVWEYCTRVKCTIVVAEVGERPTLTFVHCHYEARRLKLIVHAVRDKYERFGMLAVVRVATALATAGAIPGADGPRARKSEFLKRCTAALGALDARAETDIDKLPNGDRNAIYKMLGGEEEPYQGCYMEACLNKAPNWTTPTPSRPMVRCGRCQTPMSFGRTWTTSRDLLKHDEDRLNQKIKNDIWRSQNRPKPLPPAPESWFSDDD